MKFEPDFATDCVVGIAAHREIKSTYLENYQKYIDEFCTPPHYQNKKEATVDLASLTFEQLLVKLM